jgi:hypothetical protein
MRDLIENGNHRGPTETGGRRFKLVRECIPERPLGFGRVSRPALRQVPRRPFCDEGIEREREFCPPRISIRLSALPFCGGVNATGNVSVAGTSSRPGLVDRQATPDAEAFAYLLLRRRVSPLHQKRSRALGRNADPEARAFGVEDNLVLAARRERERR